MIRIRPTLKNDQNGFVSIVITMIMMVVLALIVIGFLQIANREQREAIDRQLSTQAFYAAESGINDAIHAYKTGYTNPKINCTYDSTLSPNNATLDQPIGSVKYTCLELQSALKQLSYPTVTKNTTLIPINSPLMQTLHISWQSTSAVSNFSNQFTSGPGASALLPTSPNFAGNTGILAISLIPLDHLDRPDLIADTLNAYLYPDGPIGSVVYGGLNMTTTTASEASQGPIVSGKCDGGTHAPYNCNVLITNLTHNGTLGYMLRVRSLYKDSQVIICGSNIANTSTCDSTLTGAQLQVDATGKDTDVLRRIQERYPLSPTALQLPEFAVESADQFCKTLQVTPNNAIDDPNCPTIPAIGD
ncbi:MAG TPA: PilX N-terminal domain-containing pilus assembly protein [Patescibacteria group bacterium]|nr:PilX N-terminal domain-containing pilus assembly protein [Patescibacteria group bacterium]